MCVESVWSGRFARCATLLFLGLALTVAPRLEAREKTRGKEAPGRLVMVINYPYQITGTASTRIHVTLFKPDFTPARGAQVKVNGKKLCKADKNGTCIFDFVPGSNKSHTLVATLEEGGRTWRESKSFSSNARTASFRSDQLFVYTDRGVYNPGDDIKVRLLAWELLADYKALPDKEVSLLLQDSAGKVVGGRKLTTNAFGVAATELPLAEHMPEGDYELVVLYNKARETARLRVERFVPPVMQITHNLKRFLTPAQKTLEVAVNVAYFAGGSPRDPQVAFAVRDNDGKTILERNFSPRTDGTFSLSLTPQELDRVRSKLIPERPFKMVVKATDSFQRSSAVARDVVYTERPYRAVLELDKDDYPAGEEVKLQAKVVDLDGKPARHVPVVCEVAAFKVRVEKKTDDQGVAEFSFKMGKTAATAVVTTPVMKVALGQRALRLNQPKPMTSKVSKPPQKQGVATHIRVTFDKRYKPVEKVIHVDFTDLSGALVVSTTIPIRREGDDYIAEGTVSGPTWGTMLANLYVCAVAKTSLGKDGKLSVNNVGFITEGQHVTLYPDAEATISIEGLKPRVTPGEKLDIEVTVRTRGGQEAALGAALVDNAVISLLDPLEVTPLDHFYNPQRKVISTGGAGVLTWPVVDRNWGNPWRDIAYTNWGFKGPGEWVGGSDLRDGEGMGGDAGVVGGAGYGSAGFAAKGAAKKSKKPKIMMGKLAVMKNEAASADEDAPGEPMPEAEAEMAKEATDVAARRSRDGGPTAKAAPKVITIRTRFPETALWEPLLETRKGRTRLTLTFPDAITVQRLTLVASDKTGGIGLVREDVEVRQDFFVQADHPAALTLGDEVRVSAVVRNLSGRTAELTVTPSASGLEFVDGEPRTLTLGDGETGAAVWTVRASHCGPVEFAATADSDAFQDLERKKLVVLPAGEPVTRTERGKVSGDQAFAAKVRVDDRAVYHTVDLSVAFPNVIPALQAWQTLEERPLAHVGVAGTASRALIDAGLLAWARNADQPAAQQEALRARLRRAATALVTAQNADGSWGWYYLPDASNSRGGYTVSVYLTAYALRALLEVVELGEVPNPEPLRMALRYLLEARNKEGLWSATGAFFWEVNAPETDWALSAELFDLLVHVDSVVSDKPTPALDKLADKVAAHLRTKPQEPATVAYAMSGLRRWHARRGSRKFATEEGRWLDYLLSLKRQGYWEPHWYHAYGGMVELNARILELLAQLDDPRAEAVRYEIVTWLLSTREAWGAWHNEIGTANAVRALLAAGAGVREERDATVTVQVNGATVTTLNIDPKDPFASAAALRHLELTRFLRGGENVVEVLYDGRLTAPVMLTVREWGVPAAKAAPHAIQVERRAATSARFGEPVEVTLRLATKTPLSHVVVDEELPANTVVDTRFLRAQVEDGHLAAYNLADGRLQLVLPRLEGTQSVTYRLLASRAGTAEHRGTRVTAPYMPDNPTGFARSEPFTVSD